MGKNSYFKTQFYVFCKNCGRVNVKNVEELNIEEDIQGRDLLTFICNKCKERGKSNVYGG